MSNVRTKRGTIAILTGGGDVPGLNPANSLWDMTIGQHIVTLGCAIRAHQWISLVFCFSRP
jgi:hypothetical protein